MREPQVPLDAAWLHSTASGPGNVTKAFGISLGDNRADLCDPRAALFIADRPDGRRPRIVRTPRVGVDYSGAWARELLRFCDAASPHVSRPRPGAKASARRPGARRR